MASVGPALLPNRNAAQSKARASVRRAALAALAAVALALGWAWVAAGPPPAVTALAPIFLEATVAAEDPVFYRHHGLRYGVRRTLAQKLARRMRPGHGKLAYGVHAVLALGLELRWSKREILQAFVDTESYGMGQRGVIAASQYYFEHGPERLTLAESAVLVGLTARAPQRWLDEDTLKAARRDGLAHLHRTEEKPVSLEQLVPAYLSPRERGAVDLLPAVGEHVEVFGYGRTDVGTTIRLVAPLLARQTNEFFREAYFRFDLRGVDHLGVYADRLVRGSATSVSAHAYGQALDVSGFRFADGSRIVVAGHDDPAVLERLLPLEALLRTYFDVVITWREDPKLHGDHYHCEVQGARVGNAPPNAPESSPP